MRDWKQLVEDRAANLKIDPAQYAAIVEELAQHLQDRYEESLSAGADETAAYRAALAELEHTSFSQSALPSRLRAPKRTPVPEGAPTGGHLLADFLRDLRYALRSMRKTPVFTFFAVLTLALGLGANTTVFTIVNTLLLHPLPVDDPSHLVAIYSTEDRGSRQSGRRLPLSYLDFQDYEKQQSAFSSMAAFTPPLVMTLQSHSGPSHRVFGQLVTRSYFKTLGIRPALGRFFLPGEDSTPGSAPVAVLSYAAWKGRFGGAPGILGRTLEINNTSLTVIGIAPKNFLGVSAVFGPDVWLPATMFQQLFPTDFGTPLTDRTKSLFGAVGRLQPNRTRSEAQSNLRTVSAALQKEFPQSDEGRTAVVFPITEELYSGAGGGGITFGSFVLFAIVALVLAIACANVANLLLARAVSRQQETAVRLAVGATRSRLIRQWLTESLLLSLLSCLAGLAIGYAGCRFVWSFTPAEVSQNLVVPKLDGTVFLFAFLISLATAFLFGIAPALRSSRVDVVGSLKEETRGAGRGKRSARLSNALVAAQVAFSLVALVIAALFLRSIQSAYRIDPGFQTAHLATFMVNPEQAGHYGESRLKDFYRTVRDRVSALPGIASVSWSDRMPFWNSPSHTVSIEGQEARKKSELTMTVVTTVGLDYFNTMAIPLIGGRTFTDTDREGALPVAVINEELAKKYWPNGDALGHRFHLSGKPTALQVVGIVKTVNYTTLGEKPQPCIYLPLQQNFTAGMTLYVRSKSAPAGILADVQHEIRAAAPNVQVTDVRTGAKLMDQVLFTPKVGVSLLGVFGSLALVLASIGLYGVMAYSVNRRRKEIGLRMALGASQSSVLGLVLREGMAVVGVGIAVGLAVSLLLGRVLAGMLFGIGSADPLSFAGASLALLLVALLACYIPARAAARIDPMLALRDS